MPKQSQKQDIGSDMSDREFKDLVESYIRKSEELQKRESKVLKQLELVQTAVTSLQEWTQSRKSSIKSSQSVRVNVKEIEAETEQIKQETARIQREIVKKQEENRKLEEELQRRRTIEEIKREDLVALTFQKALEEEGKRKFEPKLIESRKSKPSAAVEDDLKIGFFNDKLNKLKGLEKKMKEESEEAKKKRRKLEEKVQILERESEIDRELINALKKKFPKN